MKTLLLSVCLFVVTILAASFVSPPAVAQGQGNSGGPVLFGQFIKTVASTATPEALSATNLFARRITLIAKSTRSTDNTSVCYVGFTSVNDEQSFPIAAGGQIVIDVSPNTINLSSIYIDVGSNGDGVIVTYY